MILKARTYLILLLMAFCCNWTVAQTNVDFKQLHAGGEATVRSGIALSPDGEIVAIAGMHSFPLFIYDWKNDKILKKFDVGNWYAGSKVDYSSKGTYLLLQKVHYVDWAPNKDREVDFEIVDADNGKIIKKFNSVHSIKISNDEMFCLVLSGDDITFYDLPSGKKGRSFTVENATNSVAISPDGKHISVSHRPTLEQVENAPTIRGDKKAKKTIKPTLKYRQMISIYDAQSFKKKVTVNELYDIVYRLQFSKDGRRLFNYSIPHEKMQTSTAGRQGYIYTIAVPEFEPLRTAFVSLAPYEPDFTENDDKSYFGVGSFDTAPQINIHDYKTGRIKAKFDTRQRLWDGIKKNMFTDSRASFVFLPDKSILIVTGNQTIIWKPDLD